TNTNSDLPKISHLTALDVYLFFAFLLVFLSLIEYATVGYWDSKHAKAKERLEIKTTDGRTVELGLPSGTKRRRSYLIKNTSHIDTTARIVFPITFLLFNVLYTAALYVIAQMTRIREIQIMF